MRVPTVYGVALAMSWCGPPGGHAGESSAATPEVRSFHGWELYCSDDAALGVRRCHVEQGLILVVGIRHRDGTTLVDVAVTGDTPYPGGAITYRVDGNPALAMAPDGDGAGHGATIVEQMLRGQQIEARYIAFEGRPGKLRPDRVGRQAQASLAGFADAHAAMLLQLDEFGRD